METLISSPKLDTVIRTHVKNKERLSTLDRMITSWFDKEMDGLGQLIILDDSSPLRAGVLDLAMFYNIPYYMANGTPDTKNGLAESLLCTNNLALFCVDDAVFGKGIKERLTLLIQEELPKLSKWGIVGTFACYEDATRNTNKVIGTDLWEVPNGILYALVGHIFSPDFSNIVTHRWWEIKNNKAPMPQMCDDIWVKQLLKEFDYKAYNTLSYDWMQHTGMTNRTFGESGDNSNYQSKKFIGE